MIFDLRVANREVRTELAVSVRILEDRKIRDFVLPLVHLLVTLARLTGPGDLRSVTAES